MGDSPAEELSIDQDELRRIALEEVDQLRKEIENGAEIMEVGGIVVLASRAGETAMYHRPIGHGLRISIKDSELRSGEWCETESTVALPDGKTLYPLGRHAEQYVDNETHEFKTIDDIVEMANTSVPSEAT